MGHECMRCKHVFKKKQQLERHVNRKNPCKEATGRQDHRCTWCLKEFKGAKPLKEHVCKWQDDEIRRLEIGLGMDIEPIYESKKCRYCKTVYSENKKCVFHMKTCKEKETYVENLKKRKSSEEGREETAVVGKGQEDVMVEVKRGDAAVIKEAKTVNAQNAQGVQIGGHQNTQINITLNAFGSECMKHIDKEVVVKLVERFLTYSRDIEGFCRALTRMIHGNRDHPENHNVLMHGRKKALATVYNGKAYEERSAVEVTQSIIDSGADHVRTVYDENEEEMQHEMSKSKIGMVENLIGDNETKKGGRCRAAVKEALSLKDTRDMVKETMKVAAKG